MVEKVGDQKAKTNLQSRSYVCEIDARSSKDHRPSSKKNKKDKEDTQQKYCNDSPRIRLSLRPLPLLIILRLKTSKSVMEADEETV